MLARDPPWPKRAGPSGFNGAAEGPRADRIFVKCQMLAEERGKATVFRER
jgi:hypothetical protein